MSKRWKLVCLDMAGTTMSDEGLVLAAFRRTLSALGVAGDAVVQMESYVVETMGQSKIEVFTALFGDAARAANETFELEFVRAAGAVGVREIPGAADTVHEFRKAGCKVALTTGFSTSTRRVLIEQLGWEELFDLEVSPADAGGGRPRPDMLLACMAGLGITRAASMVVVGDTWSDMAAGRNAGAGMCVGVRTGTDDDERLRAGGADVVLDSVKDLQIELRST